MTISQTRSNLFATLTAVALIASAPMTALATEQPAADATMTKIDKATFVSTVASAGKFEIDSSKLALDKAQSKDVKAFARQMIKDHTKAGKQLMAAVKKDGDAPPADALSAKDAEAMKQLESASAAEFDKTYVSLQTKAHMDAVGLFKAYAAAPDDKRIGRFAKKTLPTLEMHLQHVQHLSASQ